jgi:hypothetical protein
MNDLALPLSGSSFSPSGEKPCSLSSGTPLSKGLTDIKIYITGVQMLASHKPLDLRVPNTWHSDQRLWNDLHEAVKSEALKRGVSADEAKTSWPYDLKKWKVRKDTKSRVTRFRRENPDKARIIRARAEIAHPEYELARRKAKITRKFAADFVAIDAEGCDTGRILERLRGDGEVAVFSPEQTSPLSGFSFLSSGEKPSSKGLAALCASLTQEQINEAGLTWHDKPLFEPLKSALHSVSASLSVTKDLDGRKTPFRIDTYREHCTFLWCAGNDDKQLFLGGKEQGLGRDQRPLSSVEILEWLCSLPATFPKQAKFVSFMFSYDATQIFKDMPFEKAWELQNKLPFEERAYKPGERALPKESRNVFWNGFSIAYRKGKWLRAAKLTNPNKPYKVGRDKDGNEKFILDVIKSTRITIFDTWGYFQASFLAALAGMNEAIKIEDDEIDLIEWGKPKRAGFANEPIEKIIEYNRAEQKLLARMMTEIREGLKKAFGIDRDLDWHGPGPVAREVLRKEGIIENKKTGSPGVFPAIETANVPKHQTWAHHAFFGGRIELLQQGTHKNEIFGYDISSAYPAAMLELPDMRGGAWKYHELEDRNATTVRALLSKCSAVSMARVQFNFRYTDYQKIDFYPLPYRKQNGGIVFPRTGEGIYCRDEILAAFEWCDVDRARGASIADLEFTGLWEFVPATDARPSPFIFVQKYFDERARLSALEKTTGVYDITEKVIKLVLNSLYGKMAQGVGSRSDGKPPVTSNPYFAAAITAWTRARLLLAALHGPEKIIMFATDGIAATGELDGLKTSKEKILGTWEYDPSENPGAGIFAQAGFYSFPSTKRDKNGKVIFKTKHRGAKFDDGRKFMDERMRDAWRRSRPAIAHPYTNYITLGAAVSSETNWVTCGSWKDGIREINIDVIGAKRSANTRGNKSRANKLVRTFAEENLDDELSRMYVPEWLGDRQGLIESELDKENADIALARFDDDGQEE